MKHAVVLARALTMAWLVVACAPAPAAPAAPAPTAAPSGAATRSASDTAGASAAAPSPVAAPTPPSLYHLPVGVSAITATIAVFWTGVEEGLFRKHGSTSKSSTSTVARAPSRRSSPATRP